MSRQDANAAFALSSFLQGTNATYIDEIYARIEEELRHQYSIGYTPDNAEAGYRKIHLTAKQKDLIVQTRDGYYSDK